MADGTVGGIEEKAIAFLEQEIQHMQKRREGYLYMGDGKESEAPIYFLEKILKNTSWYVLGASNSGKSYYLDHLMRELAMRGRGLCVIDPHGDLIKNFLVWLKDLSEVPREKIIYFNPGDQRFTLGLNPFDCGIEDKETRISMFVWTVLKVCHTEKTPETPQLWRYLNDIAHLLVDNDLTLREFRAFRPLSQKRQKEFLVSRIVDDDIRDDLLELIEQSKRDQKEEIRSVVNRLMRILNRTKIKRIFGKKENNLNFQEVMDNKKILLVDLSHKDLDDEEKDLIGVMITNGIYYAAKRRPQDKRPDFYFFVDEFAQYVSRAFARSLNELRKFGVHLVLSHQEMESVLDVDPVVMSSIKTNCKVKFCFNTSRDDAEVMAKELFTGQVTGGRVKHIIEATKFRPIFDTFISHSEAESEGETSQSAKTVAVSEGESTVKAETLGTSVSEATTETEASGGSSGSTYTSGGSDIFSHSLTPQAGMFSDSIVMTSSGTVSTFGHADVGSVMDMSGTSKSEGHTDSHLNTMAEGKSRVMTAAETKGQGLILTRTKSTSEVPITRHEEFKEETGYTFWSTEEEWEAFISFIVNLQPRHVACRFFDLPPKLFTTPEIPNLIAGQEHRKREQEGFKLDLYKRHTFFSAAAEVDMEHKTRMKMIERLTKEWIKKKAEEEKKKDPDPKNYHE